MALKQVLVVLLCGATTWLCEGTPTVKEVSATEVEGENKYTPVAVAVAIAEEEGTVEEASRDKRFHQFFPPNLPHPALYHRDFTPEEWEAARLWQERMWQERRSRSQGLGRSDATLMDPTNRQAPDVIDTAQFQGYPPNPSWYYGGYYPNYYPFRGPHPYYYYSGQRRLDGYCNYPYPHVHPYGTFTGAEGGFAGGRGQQGFGGNRRPQQGFGGDRGQQGFGGDMSQPGFTGSERGQGLVGSSGGDMGQRLSGNNRGQGFSGADRGQGFSGGDRGQGFSGADRGQGFTGNNRGQGFPEGDRGHSSFNSFPQSDRPSQSGQFGMGPAFGADNFPDVDRPSQAGQLGTGLSGGSQGSRPSSSLSGQSGAFDDSRRPDSFTGGSGDSFGTGNDGSSNAGGSSSFSMGSGSIPFNTGDSSPFNTRPSGVPGSLNTGAALEPGSFNPGNIPSNFGQGSPGSPNPNFSQATGSSNFNRVTLSSSSLGEPQSSLSGDLHNSPQGASSPGGFSGFGNNVQARDTQKAIMDAKNNIKRETVAAESSAGETTATS